ncbi:MAG: DUF11 domain-containing protein [bacterium]|nr:DUF11 domain-containing protein [bacterium]
MAVGAATTLDITCTVDGGTGGSTLPLLGLISAADQGDAEPANNAAGASVTVTSADLALSAAVDDATPNERQPITCSLVLTNGGPDGASGVTVSAALPAGLTYASAVASRGAYDHVTGVWTVGGLTASTTAVLEVTATVDEGTGGETLTMPATVATSGQSDPVPANNATDIAVTVTSADLGLALAVSDAEPNEGDQLVYADHGQPRPPDLATGVRVAVTLPAGIAYVSSTPPAAPSTRRRGSGRCPVSPPALRRRCGSRRPCPAARPALR